MPVYETPPVDDRAIWDIWLSTHYLPAMTAADEIGLFAALKDEALALEELAAALNVNARALSIHAALLAAIGLVEKRMGRYRATPVARAYLVPDSPYYWGTLIQGYGRALAAHQELVAMLRAGEGKTEGRPVEEWEAGAMDIERARYVARFMHAHSVVPAIAAARTPVFDGVTRLLDVGGGSGVFSIAVAQRNPGMHATVLDIEGMCIAAQAYIDDAGARNVDTVTVDMFREPWPTGYDAHFFSNVLHDWSEETCAELAAKAFAALPSGGRIVLHEQLMNDNQDGPATTASFSLLMLLGTRGKQYSLPELTAVLEGAGFNDVGSIPNAGYYSLVSATKP